MNRSIRNVSIFLWLGLIMAACNYTTPTPPSAPTATPAGADAESCLGEIQASSPVIVRPEGAGGTDTTEYGQFAWKPRAVSTSAGILVEWQTGINGQFPVPNNYIRLLDDGAQPISEISLPFERSIVQSTSFASQGDGALLTYCGIYNNGSYLTSALLDPRGNLISEQRRFTGNESQCGSDTEPDAIWTGSRLLFIWSSSYYAPNGFSNNVVLDVADASATSLAEKKIRADGALTAHLAVGHGYALIVVPTRTDFDFLSGSDRGITHLAVHRFDLEGNELREPIILEQLGTYEFGPGFLIPTEQGWLLVASTMPSSTSYYVAQLAPDGSHLSGPELIQTGTAMGFLDAVPYEDGVAVLSENRVWFLSPDGFATQEWLPSPDEHLGDASLVVHKDRLFVTYTTSGKGQPITNQVLIRELQCVR